jgi:AraC-like DNA-binding protein
MIYRTRVPRPPLSQFVELLWFYEGMDADGTKQKLLPDASMELVIDLGEGPKRLYDNRDLSRYKEFSHCWISGLHTQFIVLGVEKGASMMGAHFRTGGGAPFFRFPVSELSGSVVELDLIWKREILALREQLLEAATVDQKFDLVESFLCTKARSHLQQDPTISEALQILRSWPVMPLRDLAARLGLTHRQMLASFDCRVGVTPKVASRIFRFQKTLLAIATKKTPPDWVEVALDCGYYDQPHLIHEFQQLAGLTPGDYLRSRTDFPLYVALD